MEPSLPGMTVLTQVMNAANLRHRAIAQNVANVNTPGYKRLEVTFGGELSRAFGGPAGALRVVAVEDGPERVDGNNVDIDREMNALSKNALLYQAATQIIASRVATQRSAITGR
jgi:flagellar basal-body rod protein FlgB